MKRILTLLFLATLLAGCQQAKVMVRAVPERSDDFVFENDLIAGRFYGQTLEGNPTSPGIDVWVKLPGKLVANEWYRHAVNEDPDYYHHDHGGKDCYKVAVSLGGGASVLMVDGEMMYPRFNYHEYEILEQTPEKAAFVLKYPAWETGKCAIMLSKKVTVTAGSYFCKVEDTYTFSNEYDSLYVAAGLRLHDVADKHVTNDRVAIWEAASDQSIEPEDGMLGLAVFLPWANEVKTTEDGEHLICMKKIKSGQPLTYFFGSCWSKGDVKDPQVWFDMVDGLTFSKYDK